MIASQHTQSLSDFRQKAAETLDRLNRTGEAEILTVNGEARAVMLAPAVFDELARQAQATKDIELMRLAMKQIDDGQGLTLEEAFAPIHAELLAMKKAARSKARKR